MARGVLNFRLLLYLALGIFGVIVLLGVIAPHNPAYPPYTTHSAKPDGTKALFLLLGKEGFAVSRLLASVPQTPGLMIIMEPGSDFTDQDWARVLAWVGRGNALLLASDNVHGLPKSLGYEIVPVSGGLSGSQGPGPDNPLLKDVEELTLSGGVRLKKHASMAFAAGDERGIYLAESVYGNGRVICLTSPEIFTNKEINQKDNLILLLNIVRNYGRENIWFNEAAHGFNLDRNTRQLFTWPLRLGLIQLALGILMLFYFWGKRFGRPRPLPAKLSRFAGDYVSSLAHIYRQGRARHLILESIYRGLKQDVARYLGVPPNLSDGELVKICCGQRRIDAPKLQDLLERCTELLHNPGLSEKDLFATARAVAIWQTKNLDLRKGE